MRFSSTVMRGKMRRPSGDWARPSVTILCAGTSSIRLPSKEIEPRAGRSSPEMVRSVVVLPAPLVPISDTT